MSVPQRNPFYSEAPRPLRPPPAGGRPFSPPQGQAAPQPHFHFSGRELGHLAVGIVALTLAVSFLLEEGQPPDNLTPSPESLLVAAVSVLTGFVLHELAHKVVAQAYGHWAEFRAQFAGLGITMAVAAFTHFLFAAPGAVMIQGRVTPRENGIISLVGPGLNAVVALAAWLPALPLDVSQPGPRLLHIVALVNAVLCIFNLIPVFNLDGKKVLRWNGPVYAVAMVGAVAILAGILLTLGAPDLS
ncbi:MAG TPA: hypothetical protein VI796_04955 [Candidatus Thermoplasmatota archaeon]|nr:hypothetical protein [Candidatus Thermoplasmatota archaeon]